MGFIAHHAIICTSWDKESLEDARTKAVEIFGSEAVSLVAASQMNGYGSFFVAPDGSKEGWVDSDLGDQKRNEFLDWLSAEDQSELFADCVEVQYGGDLARHEQRVSRTRTGDGKTGPCCLCGRGAGRA